MPHRSYPQNPIIADTLFMTAFLESWGTGVSRMVEACKTVGLPEPEYGTDGSFVWITFKRPNAVANLGTNPDTTQKTAPSEGVSEGINEGVNEGDTHIDAINQIENVSDTTKIELAKILHLFHDNEGLNLKDIALRVDRPAKTVERYLKILKDLSIIEFRGAPRSGKYYVVK